MNYTQNSDSLGQHKHRLGRWLIALTILLTFGLIDATVVVIPAQVASPAVVLAGIVTFVIVAAGVLYTVWRMEP